MTLTEGHFPPVKFGICQSHLFKHKEWFEQFDHYRYNSTEDCWYSNYDVCFPLVGKNQIFDRKPAVEFVDSRYVNSTNEHWKLSRLVLFVAKVGSEIRADEVYTDKKCFADDGFIIDLNNDTAALTTLYGILHGVQLKGRLTRKWIIEYVNASGEF